MHVSHLADAEALAGLGSTATGLDSTTAALRLAEYGPNRVEDMASAPLWQRLLQEFGHFFALILWLAAALAFFAEWRVPGEGMWQLGVAIVLVILINGAFSFWQEYRAEQALAALRQLLPLQVKVLRDGVLRTLPAEALVPGDLIELEEGDQVPADCRLIEARGVRVNLSTLTGEAQAQSRNAGSDQPGHVLDASNLLFAGTALVAGACRAIVFATGMRTEFGRIAHLTQTAGETGSPLQREIGRLSRLVALFALTLGTVFFGIGMLLGLPFWSNLMFAIGIIVANVPEGLLPTVTLSLAMATQRMARRNALVRHLPAVETLGSTTVICSDKTGTLTQNRMQVRQIFAGGRLLAATEAGAAGLLRLYTGAHYGHQLKLVVQEGQPRWLGEPMEIALLEFSAAAPIPSAQVLDEIPFTGERRRMSVIVSHDAADWLYCKGAPESVLPLCATWESSAGLQQLDTATRQQITAAQEAMAAQGLRVLAFAWRRVDDAADREECNLVFSGLIGLADPPRPEVPAAIARCHSAGIRVIMVTGDHPRTATAIAREIGLIRGEAPVVILGDALRLMTPAQLQIALDAPEILFARISAEQKMLVVEALKRKGEIVAVTGDGVNDAPALKAAHIGIAMGQSGTDVAKSAADLILLDDNFASIVNAVEEGRAVFENIRKFLTYILTSNIPELLPYLGFVLLDIPLPLTIIQILAVDLGTDMLPALALGAERPQHALMRQPPRARDERLLSWPLLARAYLWLGPLQAAASLAVFFTVLSVSGWHYGDALGRLEPLYLQATSACFAAIVIAQMVNVFLCRHPQQPVWHFSLGSNPLLLAGLLFELGLLLAIIYLPIGQALFATAPFAAGFWLMMLALALLIGALEEARKAWLRHRSALRHHP
ncbi:cation-transporting P-type ATPase [Chitinilyticum litopenaei]|uniref:Cation-transporting P-type ATPase n=2 Tax=Chitinilyticum piscinae TaxID=2866724 RepID=A0A8J7K2G2_9NEIS|nr:cation-transporting P-type ATPase [Chitinilyticum piscinae]